MEQVNLASSGSEREGGFTPPPLKRARLSMDQIVGGPSIASVNLGTPSSSSQTLSLCPHGLTGMQSDSTYSGSKSSNCTGESNGCVINGYEETHETLQNGFEEFPERRKKRIRKMTTMEKDIISLMGQHLRERGYR